MTIKDAAEQTGLSPKSIRFYESKGLLRVKRGEENAYRQYSQEDLQQLRLIKLLRWLGLSVEEIGVQAKAAWKDLPEALEGLSRRLEADSEDCLQKQRFCDRLLRDWRTGEPETVVRDYHDQVRFLESEEGQGILGLLRENLCASFPAMVISSLVWLGPIGWLFLRIALREWASLPFTAAAALASSAALTLQWTDYFRMKWRHGNQLRDVNRRNRLVLPLVLLILVVGFASFIGISLLREKLLTPTGWLFYEAPWWAELGMILLVLGFIFSLVGVLIRRWRLAAADMEDADRLWSLLRRTPLVSLPLLLALGYCCFISGSYVTETEILCRSPLHPAGVRYAYTEITRVDTGFGGGRFSLIEYHKRGAFYYRVFLSDGTELVFHQPQPNNDLPRYNQSDSSYLELEDFDAALMALGVPKTASEANVEYCDLDRAYVDRFLRILRNPPK